MTTADRLSGIMGAEISCHMVYHDADEYVVVDVPDEGAFCYVAADVDFWIQSVEEDTYLSFCAACEPVEDLAVAREVFEQSGLAICAASTCLPILAEALEETANHG